MMFKNHLVGVAMSSTTRALLFGTFALAACSGPQPGVSQGVGEGSFASQSANCRKLDANLTWFGNNREEIDEFIAYFSQCDQGLGGEHKANKPVAVFDWDNTITKNDSGDMITYWMLKHDKVLQPPNRDWRRFDPFFTDAAVASIKAGCDALAEPGQPLPTSTHAECTDAIVSVYDNEVTLGGQDAFQNFNYRTMEPAYLITPMMLVGYTPEEIHAFSEAAWAENANNPQGATQAVGSVPDENYWLRIYDQTKDLILTLQANGFDVWITSASPQYMVEQLARLVNIAPDHVIGVRMTQDAAGRLTYDVKGCGGAADGANQMITYIEGKRCWVNQEIFGVQGPEALSTLSDWRKRAVFAAGDSNTDVSFVRDTVGLKLVINRQKAELMCNGYNDYQGKYLVNPMFISPKGQHSPYACSTSACFDAAGNGIPCHEEVTGNLIANQADTAFKGSTFVAPDTDEGRPKLNHRD